VQYGRNTTVRFPFSNHPPGHRHIARQARGKPLDEFAVHGIAFSALAICAWR
jgi:hypothetical protein